MSLSLSISRPHFYPLFSSSSSSISFKFSTIFLPKLPLIPPKNLRFAISSNGPSSPFTDSEQAVLDAVAASNAAAQNSLPVVRTYENDLARLTLVGAADFQQALTAAAADGGEAADEHISSGMDAMVVETVFPANDRSTVSTRLFLPARKVKEKARKLKRTLTKEILDSTSSKNILAMTFRQVVLEQLWNLELALFAPGTERDMDNLDHPREVPVLLSLSFSDERLVSTIGEVVCLAVLKNTEAHLLHDSVNKAPHKFFGKPKWISSGDSSVILHNFLENEILANSKFLLEKFKSERGYHKLNKVKRSKGSWWMSPAFTKLEKIGGPEFCAWISECIPSYMLVIDASKFSDLKFEGWKNSEANNWEIVLTHSQMVNLADILDMYYEDVFTLPKKRLSCYAVTKSSNLVFNKGSSLLKKFSIAIASGIFLVTISVLRKLYLPHLPSKSIRIQENSQPQTSESHSVPVQLVEVSQVRAFGLSVVRRIKDYFGWPGEIQTNSGGCAWVGELPTYLKKVDDVASDIGENSSTSTPLEVSEEEMKALQDIASYQVVLSADGKILGLQPTSRVAVNNWAANPLAKDLYGGKNLSPGLLEPGLRISYPSGVVILELLMSVNPNSNFAFVRAAEIS